MRATSLLLTIALGIGCTGGPAGGPQADLSGAGPDGSAALDGAVRLDGSLPQDGSLPAQCSTAAQCPALPAPDSLPICAASSFSCIEGWCTWECSGGRSCTGDGMGCVSCSAGAGPPPPRECPSAACLYARQGTPRVERASCARDFLAEIDRCFGHFAVLKDGTVCSVEELPTDLYRVMLSCGRCQTQLVFGM